MAKIKTADGKEGWEWDKEAFKEWLAKISALQTFVGSYDKETSVKRFNKLWKSKPLKRVDIEWHE